MKLLDLLRGIEFEIVNGYVDVDVAEIQYDSRKISENDVFVCIDGLEVDGHSFIFKAISSGAKVIICNKDIKIDGIDDNLTILRVKDSRIALAIMASNFYNNPANKLTIIGVTGTNGKTTSTFILKAVLEEMGIKTGLIGTIGNYIGNTKMYAERTTPPSLEIHKLFKKMIDEGCTYCVMEVSSHSLDLERVHGINFDIGIFTNLTRDHLDYHKTFDNYYKAKYKLFKRSKLSIVNIDNDYGIKITKDLEGEGKRYNTFSAVKKADFNVANINLNAQGSSFSVNDYFYDFVLPGEYNIQNATGVIASCIFLKIPKEIIKRGLKKVIVPGRCERVGIQYNLPYKIIIDYAHTPDGLYKILETIKNITDNRLIALYGSGGDKEKEKRIELGKVGKEIADIVILTSDNPKNEIPMDILNEIAIGLENHDYKIIEDRAKAIKYAISIAEKGDTIVLAGKGHEEYQIIKGQYIPFSEKDILREVFELNNR